LELDEDVFTAELGDLGGLLEVQAVEAVGWALLAKLD